MCDIAPSAVAYGEKQPTETANIVEVFEVANFLGRQSCYFRRGPDFIRRKSLLFCPFPVSVYPLPHPFIVQCPQVSLAGFIGVARPCPVLAGRPLPACPVAAGPCRAGAGSFLPFPGAAGELVKCIEVHR